MLRCSEQLFLDCVTGVSGHIMIQVYSHEISAQNVSQSKSNYDPSDASLRRLPMRI